MSPVSTTEPRGLYAAVARALAVSGAAEVLAVVALFFDVITINSNDYTTVLSIAFGCAVGSVALVVLCWRCMSIIERVFGALAVLVDLAVIADALTRSRFS